MIGIAARVGDSSGKYGDACRRPAGERVADARDLRLRHERGHVELDAISRQLANHRCGRFTFRVADGDLDVDVLAPLRDHVRLTQHLGVVVGEDFERDRVTWNRFEHVAREGLVIADPRLAHQGWIRRETLDVRILGKIDDAGLVGAVAENLHLEIREFRRSGFRRSFYHEISSGV